MAKRSKRQPNIDKRHNKELRRKMDARYGKSRSRSAGKGGVNQRRQGVIASDFAFSDLASGNTMPLYPNGIK